MATINQAVREHQTDIDWKHKEVCQRSWRIYDRFRQAYFPDLPDCYFRVAGKLLFSAFKRRNDRWERTLRMYSAIVLQAALREGKPRP